MMFFLFILFLLPLKTFGEPLSFETFNNVDTAKDLTQVMGTDRLSKYLVINAKNSNERINRAMLEQVISDALLDSNGIKIMRDDLSKGNTRLRNALLNMLTSFNYSNDEASKIVLQFATQPSNKTLPDILAAVAHAHHVALKVLVEYSLGNGSDWASVLSGMEPVMSAQSPIDIRLVLDAIVRAKGMTEVNANKAYSQFPNPTIEWKWLVIDGFENVLEGDGALARYFKDSDVNYLSWNFYVWGKFLARINNDPLLMGEYVQRLSNAKPLYYKMQKVLGESLNTKDGANFLIAYTSADIIPQSRFEWVSNYIKQTTNSNQLPTRPEDWGSICKLISDKCEQDDKWTNYFLWHLTRVGEALVMVNRAYLPKLFEDNPDLKRQLVTSAARFKDSIRQTFVQRGLYTGGGSAEDFWGKVNNQSLDQKTQDDFVKSFAGLLSADDQCWNIFLQDANTSDLLLKMIFRAGIETQPEVAGAWSNAIRASDMNLRKRFYNFLVNTKKFNDEEMYGRWLDLVHSSLISGKAVGDPNVSNFKTWLSDFLDTKDGWQAVRLRLEVESLRVPYILRNCIISYLLKHKDDFWDMYEMAIGKNRYSQASLIPQIQNYVIRSHLPDYLLNEVALRNSAAADAVDPMWTILLDQQNSTIMDRWLKSLLNGSGMGDVYRLSGYVLTQILKKPEAWNVVKGIAYSHLRLDSSTPEETVRTALFDQIREKGNEALPFIRTVLSDPTVFKMWRDQFIFDIRFMGESPSVANFIYGDIELHGIWNNEFSKMVTKEPDLMKHLFDAILEQDGAQKSDQETFVNLRQRFFELLIGDRLLYEDLLSGKNEDFRAALFDKLGRKIEEEYGRN